jgi:hypothetical protein
MGCGRVSKQDACGRYVRSTGETLPSLQHDRHRPEDVLKVDADEEGVGGDDAMMLRMRSVTWWLRRGGR